MFQNYNRTIVQLVFVMIFLAAIIDSAPGPGEHVYTDEKYHHAFDPPFHDLGFLRPFHPPKTKEEQTCYEKILLDFGGNKIGVSCMEYALLYLTLFKKKLQQNKYALEYYYDLKQHLQNESVQSPRVFCANDFNNERLEILLPMFGESVKDVIHNAYLLYEINNTAINDVIYDYMVHICEHSTSNGNVLDPEDFCRNKYGIQYDFYPTIDETYQEIK